MAKSDSMSMDRSHGMARWMLERLDLPVRIVGGDATARGFQRVLEEEAMDERVEAEAYDELVSRHWNLLHAPFIRLLDSLHVDRGTVLDIGCGPGQLTVALARRYPNLRIRGVDISPEMLDLARGHARTAGVAARVSFSLGDAKQLHGEGETFDWVYSHYTVHHLSDPVVLFDAADRLAGDRGTVVIRDLLRQNRLMIGIQVLFSRLALGYTETQLKQCRESLQASLCWEEVRQCCRQSRLRDAELRRQSLLDYVILRRPRCKSRE